MDTENKGARLLDMYERLSHGEVIYKKELAEIYGVTVKTIQRDIDELRAYLAEKSLQIITPCGATVNENGFLLSLGWRRRHSSFPLGRLSPLSKLFWSPLLNHILSRAYAP